MNSKPPVLIVCGEHSGDLLGADLMKELLAVNKELTFTGIGGKEMTDLGFKSMYEMESINVMGFGAALFKYRQLKRLANELVAKALELKVQYAILIDYPGFNLHIAEIFKSHGIKVIFYVSPQIWAWRFKRIYKIQKVVDLMLVLLPFEKKIYDEYGVPCVYVGHPLVDRLPEKIKSEEPITLKKDHRIITLMPGSRWGEIKRMLVPLLESAVLLNENAKTKNIKFQFLIPNINKKCEEFIINKINEFKTKDSSIILDYHFDQSARCIDAAELVLLSSGTATLEVAFFVKPMVIIYKMSHFTFAVGKALAITKYAGLVNILSGKEICRELLQFKCKPANITAEAEKILYNESFRKEMIGNLQNVRNSLTGNASRKAAESILKLIQGA